MVPPRAGSAQSSEITLPLWPGNEQLILAAPVTGGAAAEADMVMDIPKAIVLKIAKIPFTRHLIY
jgi:hypothetical protein